jgi:putative ABC transport system permease protein
LVELIRTDPVKALSGRVGSRENVRKARKSAVAGLYVLAASLILLIPRKAHIYVSFAGIFGFVVGVSLLTGVALIHLTPALKWTLYRLGNLPGKVAAGNIRQNLGRTGVAIAAFMVALSMSIGLGAMIGSFRQSLIWWMDTQIRAELYVGKLDEAEVPERFYENRNTRQECPSLPNVQVMYGDALLCERVDASGPALYPVWLEGGNENRTGQTRRGDHLGRFLAPFPVQSGDTIVLQGIQGPADFRVGAIFYDYTTEHGLVMMDRSTVTYSETGRLTMSASSSILTTPAARTSSARSRRRPRSAASRW